MASRKSNSKVAVDGGRELTQSAFASLDSLQGSLPLNTTSQETSSPVRKEKKGNRGRVEVRRVKAGRGGKTVTEVRGIRVHPEREKILGNLKKQLGAGGTLTPEGFEIQGERVEEVMVYLDQAGYRAVKSGG